jgi:peroxiredoxin Q/BCP
MMVEIGDVAPDFTLPGVADGVRRDYTLSEFRGKKVVLAFYPGDNTPGCTRQMCSYRDDFSKFEETGAVLLGISPQDVDSHEKWAEKRGFHFPLLADTEKQVIELYGVKGGKLIAVKRSVFVVGPDGKIAFVDRKVVGATFVSADKLVPVLATL